MSHWIFQKINFHPNICHRSINKTRQGIRDEKLAINSICDSTNKLLIYLSRNVFTKNFVKKERERDEKNVDAINEDDEEQADLESLKRKEQF